MEERNDGRREDEGEEEGKDGREEDCPESRIFTGISIDQVSG